MNSSSMAASRRADPDFLQVSGYIRKDLALRFKAACTMKETSQAEAMEEALELWLQRNQQSK